MECSLGDVTIHYKTRGTGRPILMIHGFTPDHRLMTGCMEPIFKEREGWKRIYIDLPGMGQTKGYPQIESSDDMLDVVLRFIDAVIPNESFLVAGESYGGYIARGIISERKEYIDGAAFICPLIIPENEKRTLPAHHVLYCDEDFLAKFSKEEKEEFTSISVVHDEYNWSRYRDEVASGCSIANEEFLAKIQKRYGYSFPVDERISSFDKPSLFLFGRQDSIVGFKDGWSLLDKFPRATFAVLDRAGHNLQIEQSTMFTLFIHEWLDRVEESK
ncbi:alpha/beta hydrolase [Fictibacillus sp. Mic-4]|uniref:alpha/beta fold hydrolase n=1 Tax=Fictibacillus sp. Mic-4 TaxID=3132826 RepID=UPI003CF87AA1